MTRRPAAEIDERRATFINVPFPGGESYQQVVGRVSAWLGEIRAPFAGRTVLVVGHRATFYALENLIRGVPLGDAVTAPWTWQPGWTYRVES
jgi:broad specificity phosphatase PhoE